MDGKARRDGDKEQTDRERRLARAKPTTDIALVNQGAKQLYASRVMQANESSVFRSKP